jgi:hypothetical protein
VRLPSDAQAALLSCVQEHEQAGEEVLGTWDESSRATLVIERGDHGPLHGVDYFVQIDDRYPALVPASLENPRRVTVVACARHGCLDAERLVTVTSQRLGRCWTLSPQEYPLRVLELTEDGTIALGVWRQRKLAAPPAPSPTLQGTDRDVVALAEHAMRLGYRLAPASDDARAQARRLAREGWVSRGHLGVGTRTLKPTALGTVEVDPAAADKPSVPDPHVADLARKLRRSA